MPEWLMISLRLYLYNVLFASSTYNIPRAYLIENLNLVSVSHTRPANITASSHHHYHRYLWSLPHHQFN